MFNVTHLRPRSSVSQSTVNAYRARWASNSFLALARELSPQLTPHFSADCDEGVYRTQYGAAMSWIHTHLVPQRVLHLHRPPQRQAIIAQMIEHCKINPQKKSYDVIIFNRPKERNRSILNLEVLVAQVRQLGYNVYQIPIGALYKLSQCQILSMFSSGKAVIGPYGSDLTYPLMLRIHTFSVLHYTAEDRFYSEFITLLGGGAYAYKQIYAGNTQNGSLRKFRAPLTEHGNHNFQSEMIRNYLEKNIELTDDNIQELVELVQLVVPQK